MRNITHLLAVLATSLAAAAAHAEAYEGVHQGANLRERDAVAAEAVSTAHAPDQNVSSGSRVNSVVVSTMPAAKAQASIAPATRF
jgi:hypothetical protein